MPSGSDAPPDPSAPTSARPGASRAARALAFVRRHPVTVLIVAAGTITGSVIAWYLPIGSEHVSPLVKILGGALLGAWLSILPLGFRLYD